MHSPRWILALRSLVFYLGYIPATAWFGITALMLFWAPYSIRSSYLLNWNRSVIWWLRVTCRISHIVQGEIPSDKGPFVIVSNHQSQWETFFFQYLFRPVATILKKELLAIPAFGWGLRQMQPIAIDRSSPRESLRQMLSLGQLRLQDGLSVLVYPEGTRQPCSLRNRFARGGAGLAVNSGVALLPVAHNAGHCWPAGKFIKLPGTISVCIGEPLHPAGKTPQELNLQAQSWVHQKMDEIGA